MLLELSTLMTEGMISADAAFVDGPWFVADPTRAHLAVAWSDGAIHSAPVPHPDTAP